MLDNAIDVTGDQPMKWNSSGNVKDAKHTGDIQCSFVKFGDALPIGRAPLHAYIAGRRDDRQPDQSGPAPTYLRHHGLEKAHNPQSRR